MEQGSHSTFFFPDLALIVAGSSLFSTHLLALLGLHYIEDDSRREAGFTLFYAGINLGSLLASLYAVMSDLNLDGILVSDLQLQVC